MEVEEAAGPAILNVALLSGTIGKEVCGFYYIGWDSTRLVAHVLSIHAVQQALKLKHVDKAN